MEILLSIIWLIFSLLFFVLGLYHFKLSKCNIAPFAVPERPDSTHNFIKEFGFDPDELICNFITNFNLYLNNYNGSSHRQNIAAACGYWLASIIAIVSMSLEWREEISAWFTICVSRFIETV